MSNELIEKKIIRGRIDLIYDHPFFGNLILRLKLQEDHKYKTICTDGIILGYNPDFINNLNKKEIIFCLAHEVMHLVFCHHLRRNNRNYNKWQIACDYSVNSILEESKFLLIKNIYIDSKFKGMSADKIYNLLEDEDQNKNYKNIGEIKDSTEKLSKDEIAKLERDWKINIIQAAQQAKTFGKLPKSLEYIIKNILQPKADWKEILRRFVENTAKDDYQWYPPNRRFIHKNIYLPSLISEELPPFVVVMDTSRSISHNILNQFAIELSSMLEEYQTSCIVLYCDTKIANVEEFSYEDLPLKLNPKGGGGTDFRPPFKWVEKNNITPSCLIYLTDLQCFKFPKEATYPVLWVKIGFDGFIPPFGEVIEL